MGQFMKIKKLKWGSLPWYHAENQLLVIEDLIRKHTHRMFRRLCNLIQFLDIEGNLKTLNKKADHRGKD